MRGYKIPDTEPPKDTVINCGNYREDALNARDNYNLDAAQNAALCSRANPPVNILSRMKVALAHMSIATFLGVNYSAWSDYIINHLAECLSAGNGTLCQAIYDMTSYDNAFKFLNTTYINNALSLGMSAPLRDINNDYDQSNYISLAGGLFYSS